VYLIIEFMNYDGSGHQRNIVESRIPNAFNYRLQITGAAYSCRTSGKADQLNALRVPEGNREETRSWETQISTFPARSSLRLYNCWKMRSESRDMEKYREHTLTVLLGLC
jgi:hypothetical protein